MGNEPGRNFKVLIEVGLELAALSQFPLPNCLDETPILHPPFPPAPSH